MRPLVPVLLDEENIRFGAVVGMLFPKQTVPKLNVTTKAVLEVPVVRMRVLVTLMMTVYTSGLLILVNSNFTRTLIMNISW